jgi:RNA-directed DNA polymerase
MSSGSLVLFSTCRIEPELEDFLSKEEKFSFLGFEFPTHFEPQQEVASTLRDQAQETDGAVGKTQGDLPTVCEPTRRQSDRTDQSDLRGWVNYFAVGHSGRCLSMIEHWVEKKIRRHLMRACPATQRIRLETVE